MLKTLLLAGARELSVIREPETANDAIGIA